MVSTLYDDKDGIRLTSWGWLEFLKRDDASLYNLLYQKESHPTTMIGRAWGWDMLPHPVNLNQTLTDLYLHIPQTYQTENWTLVWGSLQKSLP